MSARPARKKVVAICKPELAPFMHALGIDEVHEVSTEDEARSLVEQISDRSDVGVVLIQASLSRGLDIESRRLYPVVTPFPAPNEFELVDPGRLYRPLIRRYVGVEIRLPEGRESG